MSNAPKEPQTEQPKPQEVQTINFDDLKPQKHNWIDRGVIVSCEGAGHAYHQTSKRR